jgi:hypothetical protein
MHAATWGLAPLSCIPRRSQPWHPNPQVLEDAKTFPAYAVNFLKMGWLLPSDAELEEHPALHTLANNYLCQVCALGNDTKVDGAPAHSGSGLLSIMLSTASWKR